MGSVYANVLGTSIMSDGASASITAPNGSAQKTLIKKALKASGLFPSDMDFVEAHGTGTALGDPIEVETLAEVYARSRCESNILPVSSIKANIGHLEGAAGMAGLIKAILVLGHEVVPPNAALETLNPLIRKTIEKKEFNVVFPIQCKTLKQNCHGDKLFVAGVSSFGYSGTIAHAVVQQAPDHMRRGIKEEEDVEFNTDKSAHHEASSGVLGALFLFTGQGSQYIGMGKDLYEQNEVFHMSMDRCKCIFKSLTGSDCMVSLLEIIFDSTDDDMLLKNAQAALISIEWSLAQMWQSKNVSPTIVLGHSVGEIAAACVAGAFSIDTALKLAVERTKLVHEMPGKHCTMAAV